MEQLYQIKILKLTVFSLSCLPLIFMLVGFINDSLGANRVENLMQFSGQAALNFILLTLTIRPISQILNYHALIRIRRMLGLFCYLYASTHFSIYLVLEQWLDLALIIEDIKERPFITIGVINLILLTPLALTSTDAMRARLQTNWSKLHKLIYLISILAIIHYWWSAKADLLMPIISAFILTFLLAYRVFRYLQMRSLWKITHN